jgi:large subunit ribosomal protein L1
MDKKSVQKSLNELKENTSKRNFSQTFDLVINLKNFDPKSNSVNEFITMPFSKGKKPKVAALVGTELKDQAKLHCDLVIPESEFSNYDQKQSKKLAQDYDYFIAQATLMPQIAKAFGKALGTRGKMPNPKIGCVVPPNANLAPLIEKLNRVVQVATKKATNLQCAVGNESMPDEEIVENILAVYHGIVRALPNELQNVKKVQLKLTMGKPVTL